MKKLILGLLMCAVMSAPALATITITPSDGECWTHQEWTFSTQPPSMTGIEADVDENPYGTPTADVALTGFIPPPGWYPEALDGSGHTGLIFGNTATIDLHIPNIVNPDCEKIIQVEVVYHIEEYIPGHGYIDASSYVEAGTPPYRYGDSISVVDDKALAGGWRDVTIEWRIPQIYPVEVIHLYFVDTGVTIDKIEVATVCVPEPATLLLLGGAGLIGWLRRRRTL